MHLGWRRNRHSLTEDSKAAEGMPLELLVDF
jgi:hypothetical protein